MFPIDKAKIPVDGREKSYRSTTWSLNPQNYQNVSNDMVDWAALAQQWIQMKETYPNEDMPAAPPPPPLSGSDFEEQGEAPMEVVEKEEEPMQIISPPGTHQWAPTWNTFRPQTQWRPGSTGWNNWANPSMVAPPAPSIMRTAILPTDFRNPPPIVAQQLIAPPAVTWPRVRFPAAAILTPIGTLPEPKGDDHVSNSPKSDVNFIQADTTTTIDAAKRKNLPAWIREGLEKMERAKQRQAEKEREEEERREEIEKRRQVEAAAFKEFERLKKEEEEEDTKLPVKSKFESDTDSETDGEISDRHQTKDSPRSRTPEVKAEVVKKTFEEVMLDVRKTLTEILLEVTNEEILEIAKETIARAQKKKPKPILGQSSIATTSNLPGRLGLAIYGSSDSEGDDTEDDENTQGLGKNDDSDERDSADSDLELQEKIKRQVNAFKKTSREIEEQLAAQEEREERKRLERLENEERERRKLSFHDALMKNNGNVEKKRDGETEQLDRNSTKVGKSSRPKKQSRFSDPKDTVRGTHLTHVSILGAYKSDALTAGLTKLRQVGEALEAAAERSGGSRSNTVTTLSSRTSSSHSKSSRSRRRSSTSDDDDVSSTCSSNSNRRRRRRSRSSDRHSRHSHSSHSSRRTRSRSRSRERKSERRGR